MTRIHTQRAVATTRGASIVAANVVTITGLMQGLIFASLIVYRCQSEQRFYLTPLLPALRDFRLSCLCSLAPSSGRTSACPPVA